MKNKETGKSHGLAGMIILAGLIIITFVYLLRETSVGEIADVISEANLGFAAVIFILMFMYISLEGYNEYLLLKAMGSDIRLKTMIQISFVGYYFSMITPSSTGGQPLQAYYLKKKGQNISDVSLVLVAFTLVYQAVLLTFCMLMMLLQHKFLTDGITAVRIALIYGFAVGSALIISLIVILVSKKTAHRIVVFFINLLSKLKLVKDKEKSLRNTDEQIDMYESGVKFLFSNPKHLLRMSAIIVLQLCCYFSIPYFALYSLGIKQYSLYQIIGVQSVLHVSVCSVPIPGSVGANETIFFTLYAMLVPAQLLLPSLILSRGAGFFVFLLISAAVSLYTHLTSRAV